MAAGTAPLKIACGLIAALPLVCSAAEAKDPRTRNEDISATRVEVNYAQRDDGLYEYIYTVRAPAENLGYVNMLTVDLACTVPVPGSIPPPPSAGQGYLGDHSDDGNHVPATVSADYGQAGLYGITLQNKAMWAVTLRACTPPAPRAKAAAGRKVSSPVARLSLPCIRGAMLDITQSNGHVPADGIHAVWASRRWFRAP